MFPDVVRTCQGPCSSGVPYLTLGAWRLGLCRERLLTLVGFCRGHVRGAVVCSSICSLLTTLSCQCSLRFSVFCDGKVSRKIQRLANCWTRPSMCGTANSLLPSPLSRQAYLCRMRPRPSFVDFSSSMLERHWTRHQ